MKSTLTNNMQVDTSIARPSDLPACTLEIGGDAWSLTRSYIRFEVVVKV